MCEGERKNYTLARVISDLDGASVRLHDLFHDGETQTYTSRLDIPASPEPFEYPLALVDWNPRTMIGNAHTAGRQHLNGYLFAARRMGDGIFDKVPDRVLDRVSISPDYRPAHRARLAQASGPAR